MSRKQTFDEMMAEAKGRDEERQRHNDLVDHIKIHISNGRGNLDLDSLAEFLANIIEGKENGNRKSEV